MKNRIKKFINDNGDVIIVVAPYVVAGVVYLYFNKKLDGTKIIDGGMTHDDNTFVVYMKNGTNHAFHRPGTTK